MLSQTGESAVVLRGYEYGHWHEATDAACNDDARPEQTESKGSD